MTLTIAHTVELGGSGGSRTDFTSRVLGFTVQQEARPQRINRNRAIITLDNSDGALTPNAGGTYDSVDWFSQGVFITSFVNAGGDQTLFHGIIDDFQLADNGTQSTVQIVALDWVAVLGRLSPKDLRVAYPAGPGEAVAETIVVKLTGTDDMLKLGAGGTVTYNNLYATDNTEVPVYLTTSTDQFITDVIQNDLMAADLSVIYGRNIEYLASIPSSTIYNAVIIGNTLTRSAAAIYDTLNVFEFTGATPTAGQLPIADVITGYNIDELVNTVISTRDGGTAQKAQNTDSTGLYGARTMTVTGHAATTDTAALNGATNMVNRLSTTRFIAQRIELNSANLAKTPAGSATQLELLMDTETALWQPCTITYTPTGAASTITDKCLIYGRQIRVTAAGTSIVLDLLSADDYQSLVLDSAVLGILDENRLG